MDFFTDRNHSQLSSGFYVLLFLISFYSLQPNLWGADPLLNYDCSISTMALILGNILAHPLSDEQLGMKGSLITTAVLVVLYTIGVHFSLKWNLFRKVD